RFNRDFVSEQVPATGAALDLFSGKRGSSQFCTDAGDALAEAQFGLELLVARGEIGPDSEEAETFVQSSLRAVVMHEVGHTLGLRNTFRASTIYSLDRISNPEFTRSNGISGSVMDYNPINLALKGA